MSSHDNVKEEIQRHRLRQQRREVARQLVDDPQGFSPSDDEKLWPQTSHIAEEFAYREEHDSEMLIGKRYNEVGEELELEELDALRNRIGHAMEEIERAWSQKHGRDEKQDRQP